MNNTDKLEDTLHPQTNNYQTVGGVGGEIGSKAVAIAFDPKVELAYWETNYCLQNYYEPNLPYSEYQPAYLIAIGEYRPSLSFEESEAKLRQRWETENPNLKLPWESARQVMQDAWQRLTVQH